MKHKNLKSLLLIVVLAAAPFFVVADTPPKIVIGERVLDFGRVSQGEQLELQFMIANEGGEALSLQMRPTCGCTLVDYPETIAAGAEGVVTATLDTTGLRGPIEKSILVVCNDPDSPSLRLAAKADVQPVFTVLPKPMVRLSVVQGETASATVKLQAVDPRKSGFTVTSVEPEASHVTASARRVPAGANGTGPAHYEIDLEVTEKAPLGFLNVPVVIHTDHPTAKTVRVTVVGTVRRGAPTQRQG